VASNTREYIGGEAAENSSLLSLPMYSRMGIMGNLLPDWC